MPSSHHRVFLLAEISVWFEYRPSAAPLHTPLPQRRPGGSVGGACAPPRTSSASQPRSFAAAQTPRTMGTPLPNGSPGTPSRAPSLVKGSAPRPPASRMQHEAPLHSPSPPLLDSDGDAAMPDHGAQCICAAQLDNCVQSRRVPRYVLETRIVPCAEAWEMGHWAYPGAPSMSAASLRGQDGSVPC